MEINGALLSTMIAGGGIMGLLYQLKSLPNLIYRKIKQKLVYTTIVYDGDELYYAIEHYFYNNYGRKYLNVEAGYNILDGGHTPKNSGKRTVQYKQGNNFFIMNFNKKKLLIKKTKEKIEHATDVRALFSFHFSISGWKAKEEITALLNEITEEYNKLLEDKRIVFKVWGWGDWQIHSRRDVKPLDRIILERGLKNSIVGDIDKFVKRKEWYKDVGIVYKRSYMFYGPPGTGKSTLSFAIASYLQRNVHILNLNSFSTDAELTNSFTRLESGGILLIEDIDSAFVKRENSEKTKITFSCLLNCLDGAMSKDDVIVIMTTNHIEKLDEALLRCGRTDVKIELGYPTFQEISEYLSLFYQEDIKIFGEFSIPMSQVQEICIKNSEDVSQCKKELYSLSTKTNGKLIEA